METDNSYNGWANYETWNVSLWIDNDEGIHDFVKGLYRMGKGYNWIAQQLKEFSISRTPDGVYWDDPLVDREEMERMLEENFGRE